MMLCDSNKCTGCGACVAACPVQAISLQEDENGFQAPSICQDKCINCGRCTTSCPILNPPIQKGRISPTAWAFRIEDEQTLLSSASGGAFSMLAREIFRQGGTVWGAVWNENHDVLYACAENEQQLSPMRGSKYVQSNASMAYAQVKRQLQAGRTVLFAGVPCQIAGLYSFLGKTAYQNLYTAEIVCHGGGSPRMLREDLKEIEKRENSRIVRIDQTSKCRSWSILIQRTICVELENGKKVILDSSEDPYLSLFLNGALYRECCYACPFATIPRVADITIGDFFGFGIAAHHRFKTQGGISQIIVNTLKGQALFDTAYSSSGTRQKCCMEECLIFNHNLWRPTPRPAYRDEIFQTYRKEGFKVIAQNYYDTAWNRNKRRGRRVIKKILGPKGTAFGMYLTYRMCGLEKKVREILTQVDEQNCQ